MATYSANLMIYQTIYSKEISFDKQYNLKIKWWLEIYGSFFFKS